MTKEQIKALIAKKLAGQGNQVDLGSALPTILEGIVDDLIKDFSYPVTWAELKALRDAGELIPGMRYRITDYVATTIQKDTRSANHPFDIIVVADSANTLNENATAIQHDGDEYFADSNLAAWKLKYSLDNDATRFIWADNRLLPEWIATSEVLNGEHLPYQGMQILPGYEEYGAVPVYGTPEQGQRYGEEWDIENVLCWCGWDADDDKPIYPVRSGEGKGLETLTTGYDAVENLGTEVSMPEDTVEFGKGVVYYLEDEFNNKVGFDFKGIQFKRYQVLRGNMVNDQAYVSSRKLAAFTKAVAANSTSSPSQVYGFAYDLNKGEDFGYFEDPSSEIDSEAQYIALDDPTWLDDPHIICKIDEELYEWFYLFNSTTESEDCSLNPSNKVRDNLVPGCQSFTPGSYLLPNNVFFGGCANNVLGVDCKNNTFGHDCNNNILGNSCVGNTFQFNFYSNTLGDDCCNNIFGGSCYSNSLGYNAYVNLFDSDCYKNTFGSGVCKNILGSRCCYNTFGNAVVLCIFGDRCTKNILGDEVAPMELGGESHDNVFRNENQVQWNYAEYVVPTLVNVTIDSGVSRIKIAPLYDDGSFYKNLHITAGDYGNIGFDVPDSDIPQNAYYMLVFVSDDQAQPGTVKPLYEL